MTQQEFIEFIDIDQKGHYPFQCFGKETNGETFLAAMAVPDIASLYFSVDHFLESGVEFLHFSADFPKHGSRERRSTCCGEGMAFTNGITRLILKGI